MNMAQMTLLQQIRAEFHKHAAFHGEGAKVASAMGINVKILSEILRGKRPIPACVWEYLIANRRKQ